MGSDPTCFSQRPPVRSAVYPMRFRSSASRRVIVFRDLFLAVARDVDNVDTVRGGRLEIEVVNADTAARDDSTRVQLLHDGRSVRCGVHTVDDRVGGSELLFQVVRRANVNGIERTV